MSQVTVSVYQHAADKTIFLIPMAKDAIGLEVEVNKPVVQHPPYTPEQLGQSLLHVLATASQEPLIPTAEPPKVFTELTGIKNYKKFSEDRLHTTLSLITGRGYVCLPYRRDLRGSYSGTGDKLELPADATAIQLGEMLLDSLSRCTC